MPLDGLSAARALETTLGGESRATDKIVRVPGLVHASSVVDFEAFKNDDVYKAGPDLGGHDSEMIGGAARGARLAESW